MGIQKDIQQSAFRSNKQKAIVNIIYSYNWLNSKLGEFFQNYHLSLNEYNILRILKGAKEALTILEISNRQLDKSADLHQLINLLCQKELVEKTRSKDDKSIVKVVISQKAKQLLTVIEKRTKEIDNILGKLSEEEAALLSDLLDKIRG